MKTYRITWSRIDHKLEREDYFHVIFPSRNKVMALATVRKYFTNERRSNEEFRYGHYVVSLEVEIGKGNRSASYWRALNHQNIYLADYRFQSLAVDITPLVVPGVPSETPSEMRQAFDVQEWMVLHPRDDARYNDILRDHFDNS